MTVSGGVSGGQHVAGALHDVVVDLGRPAAFDPARLRSALSQALSSTLTDSVAQHGGERAAELSAAFSPLVDALVVAAEEAVPDGMLDDVPAIDLVDRLEARKMPAELMGWVLHTWGGAVRLADQLPTTPIQAPIQAPIQTPTTSVADQAAGHQVDPAFDFPPAPAFPDFPDFPDFPAEYPAEYPVDFRTRRPSRRRGPLIALAAVLVLVAAAGLGARLALGSGDVVDDREDTRAAAQVEPTPPPAPDVPALLAYRGGDETFPPDTLPAIEAAARAGAGVELDLRWTSDGVPVLMRNARVQPPMYCAERYPVATTPWTVLANCLTQASVSDDGKSYGIARLDTTLGALAKIKGAQLFLEIKIDQTDEQDRRLLGALESAGMTGRTVVGSLLPAELGQLRAAATADGSSLRLMQFVRDRKLAPAAARTAGLWAVAVKQSALERDYVEQLRAAGLKVVAWTPDDAKQWDQARKAGVDYLETAKPAAYAKWAAGK